MSKALVHYIPVLIGILTICLFQSLTKDTSLLKKSAAPLLHLVIQFKCQYKQYWSGYHRNRTKDPMGCFIWEFLQKKIYRMIDGGVWKW